jgi:undecaprenyl-diphosphatase
VGGLVILGLTAASAAVYDAVAEKDGVSSLDRPALAQVIAWRTPLADRIFTGFTHLGGPLLMTLIASAVTLLMVWRWRSPTPLILMIIAVAGSLTFTNVGKAIVGRARPPLSDAVPPYEHAFSFPSGPHAEQHRHRRPGRVSRRHPAHQPPRHRPVRRSGRRLGGCDGF